MKALIQPTRFLAGDPPAPASGLVCGSPADRGAHAQRIFRFHQHVVRTSRESDDAATEREEYERTGLVLLDSEQTPTSWTRSLVECAAPPDELAKWFRVGGTSRATLSQSHQRDMFAHSMEVTTPRPLGLLSDRNNENLSSTGEAVPFFAIGWPTVLPVFGPKGDGVEVRRGEVLVSFGFGLFAVRHVVHAHESADSSLAIEVSLDPKAVHVAGRNVKLTMHPVGTVGLIVDSGSHIPRTATGQISLAVRAEHTRDGKAVSFEIGRLTSSFEYQAVPGSFDADFVELQQAG